MIPDTYYAEQQNDGLGEFAFDFEKQERMTASGDEDVIEDKLFNMASLDQFASDTGLFPQVSAPLPLRPYRSFAKANDRGTPTISGRELRNLEGKSSPEGQMASLNMPVSSGMTSSSAAPTLRRKGRFGPSVSNAPRYHENQQMSRMPSNEDIDEGFQPPEIPMSPSSCEWTQRFHEQISLHTNRQDLVVPLTHNFQELQRENFRQTSPQISPRELYQHRKTTSEHAATSSFYSLADYSQPISHSIPRDMNGTMSMLPTQTAQSSESSPQRPQPSHISNGLFRQHRPTQSWGHAPTAFSNDYTVSPNQIHQTWVQGLPEESYLANMAYPTPTSQDSNAVFGHEDLDAHCYAPSEVPLSHHNSYQNLQASQDTLLNSLANRRPHTPPPSNPSASPPTPEVTPSPQKQTRASARRQGNVNSLRLRKSTAALKPAKSLSALKSPKSAGHLRGKKSIGGSGSGSGGGIGLNNHHHQQNGGGNTKSPIKKEKSQPSGMNFGFMNYTADDKQKILTGVAPSGSSKTKARRELEANEERLRLIQAIQIAGGDSEGLKRELNVKIET